MVALDYRLKNSETVEIITAKTAQPSRDWLSARSGFLASPRHRNKVRAWFRKQNESQNKVEGTAKAEGAAKVEGAAQVAGAIHPFLHPRNPPSKPSPTRITRS